MLPDRSTTKAEGHSGGALPGWRGSAQPAQHNGCNMYNCALRQACHSSDKEIFEAKMQGVQALLQVVVPNSTLGTPDSCSICLCAFELCLAIRFPHTLLSHFFV